MLETPISNSYVGEHSIDSHIWEMYPGQPLTAAPVFSIADFDRDDLLMATFISLFTDRRFTFEDGDPPVENDRRGWWGDNLLETPGDSDGSLLWLLMRSKIIEPDTLNDATEYCEEALQWLIDDGVAEDITVSTERIGIYKLKIDIEITRPGEFEKTRYFWTWDVLENTFNGSTV